MKIIALKKCCDSDNLFVHLRCIKKYGDSFKRVMGMQTWLITPGHQSGFE